MTQGPTVVAISRQFGSGGAWVGRAVARRLGFQYADREILAEAARVLEVETSDVEPLEERVGGLWDRIAALFWQGAVDAPFTPPILPSVTEAQLFAVERQVIETMASRGRAVIVGRGAAHILTGRPDVIRVFLHAPVRARVARAMQEYAFDDEEAAATVLRTSDAHRARFARTLTGHDWCDATLYDLCLDAEATTLERAAEMIVALVEGGLRRAVVAENK